MGGHEKEQLRRLLLARRDATSAGYMRVAAEAVRKRLRAVPEFCDADTVGAYYSTGSEVPTRAIIQEAVSEGRRVCLPRAAGGAMEFFWVEDPGDLEEGAFGIMEPRASRPAAGRLDVVLVPAVGVSRTGGRLGYGRGYYDRFLAGCGAFSIALALDKQLVGEIPAEAHDVPVDCIVTELATVRV